MGKDERRYEMDGASLREEQLRIGIELSFAGCLVRFYQVESLLVTRPNNLNSPKPMCNPRRQPEHLPPGQRTVWGEGRREGGSREGNERAARLVIDGQHNTASRRRRGSDGLRWPGTGGPHT